MFLTNEKLENIGGRMERNPKDRCPGWLFSVVCQKLRFTCQKETCGNTLIHKQATRKLFPLDWHARSP